MSKGKSLRGKHRKRLGKKKKGVYGLEERNIMGVAARG